MTLFLQAGDIILNINGTNFRDDPDAEKAANLITNAKKVVNIEYQKISSFFPAVPVELSEQPVPKQKEVHFVLPAEHLIESESRSSDQHAFSANFDDVSSNAKDSTVNDDYSEQGYAPSMESYSRLVEENKKVTHEYYQYSNESKRQRMWITVTRRRQGGVGLNLAKQNGKVVVTKVSLSGILRNAPLRPGDTILSINDIDFRSNPNAKEALNIVNHGPRKLTFEVLKTAGEYSEENESTKMCLIGSILFGGNRRKR